ncbi:MAG TPA: hypothetical protein DCL80_07475 [Balneola sp.]|nr:hypothetical protein [Bacteroidota bacterium]MAC05518.1 hypothetical protein [Balneola sp.]MAB66576.1 hypothetical protein [Bacteroidota bacterium]MAO77536.1 hypothetical protein [Balneola sp.]MBF63212.1 hypothetical protein [Balneola sp.]|tara:strand:- start:838 stop:1038 length:201 start_codon:yes stop_codon:yes gene_type:complete
MLWKLLLIIGFILFLRYVNRMFLPSGKKTSQFNPFQGFGNTPSSNKRKNIDQIEDADYEDITNKDK